MVARAAETTADVVAAVVVVDDGSGMLNSDNTFALATSANKPDRKSEL
jgi:hypothetical protein